MDRHDTKSASVRSPTTCLLYLGAENSGRITLYRRSAPRARARPPETQSQTARPRRAPIYTDSDTVCTTRRRATRLRTGNNHKHEAQHRTWGHQPPAPPFESAHNYVEEVFLFIVGLAVWSRCRCRSGLSSKSNSAYYSTYYNSPISVVRAP